MRETAYTGAVSLSFYGQPERGYIMALLEYNSRVKMVTTLLLKAIRDNVPVSRVYNQTTGTELGIRKADFYRLVSDVKSDTAVTLIPRKYRYSVGFRTFSNQTGVETDRWIYVDSDRALLDSEIMDLGDTGIADIIDQYDETIDSGSIYGRIKRGEL